MRVERLYRGLIVIALTVVQMACVSAATTGRIPSYAQPKWIEEGGVLTGEDVIRYRPLTRGDFRGSNPPAHLGENARFMGAVTCAFLRAREGSGFEVRKTETRVIVRAIELEFEAMMDRGCSWWNEKLEVFAEAYVLEHEQIHLAIFEVEARRLSRRAADAAVVIGPVGSDPHTLAEEARAIIEREVDASKEAVLARSLAFDEETSSGHEPELQKEWLHTVERELRDGAP